MDCAELRALIERHSVELRWAANVRDDLSTRRLTKAQAKEEKFHRKHCSICKKGS